MHEIKFIDGTPVPDNYLTAVSQLVRDATLAIDMFGEGELETELGNGYLLRIYAGFGRGDVDAAHPTLEAAIAAFDAAPEHSIPRVVQNGKTLIERDPEAGLAPMFWDAEAERVYWERRQPPPTVVSS